MEPITARRVLTRLFLVDSMHTIPARVLAIFDYVALAWAFMMVRLGGGLFGSTAKAGSDVFIGFIFFAWFVAIGVAPALVLNWLAVWADRRGDHSKPVPSGRLQPPT